MGNGKLLRLYVAGRSAESTLAEQSIRTLCEEELRGNWRLEIVDVLERPQLAEDHKIVAVPAVIKALPPPVRRVIGDFSDRSKVLIGLDIVKDVDD